MELPPCLDIQCHDWTELLLDYLPLGEIVQQLYLVLELLAQCLILYYSLVLFHFVSNFNSISMYYMYSVCSSFVY